MRTILGIVLAGVGLALGACQSTDMSAANAGETDHYVVSGGQSRYSVDIPRREAMPVENDGSYSLTGENARPSERTDPQRTSSYVRQGTNGNF